MHSKQIVNAIYDSGNYTEKFEQDIVEAEKMIVISSPDIRQNKIDRLLLLVKGRQEKGVKVRLFRGNGGLKTSTTPVFIWIKQHSTFG